MRMLKIVIWWISKNYVWLISLVIQAIIAYHVFFLSKRLSSRARLGHKDQIKKKAEELLSKVNRRMSDSEVYLVNLNRYFKDYPSNEKSNFRGYSHIRAEIKATRFDGIEFFAAPPVQIYEKPSGELSLKGEIGEKAFIAFPVGIVPYDWIEHMDLEGDECGGAPLFYCHFKGKMFWKFWNHFSFSKYPYKRTVFYKRSESYNEANDPPGLRYSLVHEAISNK
jgi:hypothetical protein